MMRKITQWALLMLIGVGVLTFEACKKDDDTGSNQNNNNNNQNNNNNNQNDTADFFVSMLVDGDTVKMEPTVGGVNPIGFIQVDATMPPDSCIYNYAGGMGWTVGVSGTGNILLTGESILFELARYFEDSCDKEDVVFRSLFPTGSVDYSPGPTEKGVIVWWVDANDKIWRSDKGAQTGSTFNITASDSIDSGNSAILRQQMKGTFNCTVYDDASNNLLITNGEFAFTVDDRL